MDQIRELILTWQVRDVANAVAEDEDGIEALIRLLGEDDPVLQLRTLSVIESLLREYSNGTFRKYILRNFDSIILMLSSQDDRVVLRTLNIIKLIVENTILPEVYFNALLSALYGVSSRGGIVWISVVDLVKSIPTGYYSLDSEYIDRFLNSSDIFTAAVGLRILSTQGYPLRGRMVSVQRVIGHLLDSNDDLLLETAMDAVVEMLTTPSQEVLEVLMRSAYSRLIRLSRREGYVLIRSRAREVVALLKNALVNYYSRRPEDARELAERLRHEGFVDEAMALEGIVPSYSLNSSTVSLLREDLDDIPRFLREL